MKAKACTALLMAGLMLVTQNTTLFAVNAAELEPKAYLDIHTKPLEQTEDEVQSQTGESGKVPQEGAQQSSKVLQEGDNQSSKVLQEGAQQSGEALQVGDNQASQPEEDPQEASSNDSNRTSENVTDLEHSSESSYQVEPGTSSWILSDERTRTSTTQDTSTIPESQDSVGTVDSQTNIEEKPEEKPEEQQIAVAGISLSETQKTVYIKDSFTIKVNINPKNATNQTVVWKTSNSQVVTVSGSQFKALNKGEVTITATAENGVSATCKVKVLKYRYGIAEGVWKQNSVGYYFEFPDKSYLYSDWALIKGKWYYFDSRGYMKTGWLKDKGKWYYLDHNGAMVTGFKTFGISGILLRAQLELGYEEKASYAELDYAKKNPGSGNYTKYARDLNNAGLSGFQGQPWCGVYQMWLEYMSYGRATALEHLGPSYYNVFSTRSWAISRGRWLGISSTPQVGDVLIFSRSHIARVTAVTGSYFDGLVFTNEGNTSDGVEVDRDGGKVCAKVYARNNPGLMGYIAVDHGAVEKEWYQTGPKRYYLKQNGDMAVGWTLVNGTWYYMEDSGLIKTGWLKWKGFWYYLDRDGKMKTGWLEENKKWYYLESSGKMSTGWKKLGGKWYYLDAGGKMLTGWVSYKAKWYYLRKDGDMATGWILDSGKWYYLEGSGIMATGWIALGGKEYYLKPSGAMATGWYRLPDANYYFSPTSGTFTGLKRA